jgi:predicted secreted protein
LRGKAMEAFEKYYAEDVVMQENELPPTIGKDANGEREKEFFSKVVEFNGADVTAVAIGDGVMMVEWFFTTRIRIGEGVHITRLQISAGRMVKLFMKGFIMVVD